MAVTVKNFQLAKAELLRELNKFRGGLSVTIGIHEDAADPVDGELTMAGLGATLNYGADINHPGGTAYGYASEKDVEKNQVRFLGKGKGYAVLGYTKPHRIVIPARPWLIPGVESADSDIIDVIKNGVSGGLTLDQTMEQIGVIAAGAVQQYMTDLDQPANAASTIRKKKSSNPLIDTGALRASVTYKVTKDKPEEGI